MSGAITVPAGQIDEDQWDDFFEHIPNPVDGSMIWDYSDPKQMEALRQYPEDRVWTFSDCDGGQCITTGISWVNRVGYCITKKPYPPHEVWAFIPDLCSECGERPVEEAFEYEWCSTCGPEFQDKDEDEEDDDDDE